MSAERFLKLVEDQDGFEFVQAYQKDVDHFLGGKGDTIWYFVLKRGKVSETYIGHLQDGVWEDTYTKGKRIKTLPAGTTIGKIVEKAYLCQEETWVKDRKGKLIEDAHPHYHYTYGFGEKGLDVSAEYGVTISFSDIHDVPAGFHLRDLSTGDAVELP